MHDFSAQIVWGRFLGWFVRLPCQTSYSGAMVHSNGESLVADQVHGIGGSDGAGDAVRIEVGRKC